MASGWYGSEVDVCLGAHVGWIRPTRTAVGLTIYLSGLLEPAGGRTSRVLPAEFRAPSEHEATAKRLTPADRMRRMLFSGRSRGGGLSDHASVEVMPGLRIIIRSILAQVAPLRCDGAGDPHEDVVRVSAPELPPPGVTRWTQVAHTGQ